MANAVSTCAQPSSSRREVARTNRAHAPKTAATARFAKAGAEVPHRISGRRLGDPATVYADSALAGRTLGWTATRGLREIISSAYAWHRQG